MRGKGKELVILFLVDEKIINADTSKVEGHFFLFVERRGKERGGGEGRRERGRGFFLFVCFCAR